MTPTPYAQLPAHKFWRTGVSQKNVSEYQSFWSSKWELPESSKFSTYGSCFAQHISRSLKERKLNWVNTEAAPHRTPDALAKAYNYGVFSSRVGNIYTVRQLLMWLVLANDPSQSDIIETWEQDGRFYDSLRPMIEPDGFASAAEVLSSRVSTARAFARSIRESDVFVFTLGLTEGWENAATGQVYPVCPGTTCGRFDASKHTFKNYTYPEVKQDLETAIKIIEGMNPNVRILLTVSPVAMTATLSNEHVLSANTYSKSVLRCVAGDLSQAYENVDYFPAYELISSAPTRGMYYDKNMRSVVSEGVDLVMEYFFKGLKFDGAQDDQIEAIHAQIDAMIEREAAEDLVCEEMELEPTHAS